VPAEAGEPPGSRDAVEAAPLGVVARDWGALATLAASWTGPGAGEAMPEAAALANRLVVAEAAPDRPGFFRRSWFAYSVARARALVLLDAMALALVAAIDSRQTAGAVPAAPDDALVGVWLGPLPTGTTGAGTTGEAMPLLRPCDVPGRYTPEAGGMIPLPPPRQGGCTGTCLLGDELQEAGFPTGAVAERPRVTSLMDAEEDA
jgi:hypothetical protein